MGKRLSRTFQCGVFACLVHDSDVFYYVLYEDGKQADEYDSSPGYFNGKSLPPQGGAPGVLVRYCRPGTTEDQLQVLLSGRPPGSGRPGLEVYERFLAEADRQRKQMAERYPQVVEEMRRIGAPIPSLEEMLQQFERMLTGAREHMPAAREAAAFLAADELAGQLGDYLGLGTERCTVGYRYIAQGEAPQGMVFLVR